MNERTLVHVKLGIYFDNVKSFSCKMSLTMCVFWFHPRSESITKHIAFKLQLSCDLCQPIIAALWRTRKRIRGYKTLWSCLGDVLEKCEERPKHRQKC